MEEPRAKKGLGQHWLRDNASLDAMIEAADVARDDVVLEIGPGLGTLTEKLAQQAKRVEAVEFDAALARDLPNRVPADNVTVIQQDILRYDLTALPPDYKVVANIPYYLTSNLLRVLCESTNPFSKAALLMQKEVAERVCAEPGDMGLLSVSVQFYCHASLGRVVPAGLFVPPPKVDSQILRLAYRSEPLFPGVDRRIFFRIVKAGFSQRRKTILNSLSAGLNMPRGQVASILAKAGIATNSRAQALSLSDWYAIYRAAE